MSVTAESNDLRDVRTLHAIADDLTVALDDVERAAAIPLGGFVELPTLASKVDRIAVAIADIEFEVPDEFCEEIDLDLTALRGDFRRLAACLMDASKATAR